MSATVAESLVSRVEAAMGPLPAPSQLQDMIEEHRKHVLTLAAAVLGSGRDVAFVGQLVDDVLRSYRDELVKAIMALREVETRLEAEPLCDVFIDTLGSEALITAADSPARHEPSPTDPLPDVAKIPPSRCHPLPLLRPSAANRLPRRCRNVAGSCQKLPATPDRQPGLSL